MRDHVCINSVVASTSLQNPGFDFLLSCWNDDPALVIAIKKLLAKFHSGVLQLQTEY
ncbi:hypothetical protein [Nostoc flagelliforme]|uniref:hypothetical protein n=1 Tax=Nostoc flagelliforme TaxID=1306274 RepID=UPI001F54CEC0|nr:hypothetical protein [Nostoc flagelliforme]